MKDKKKTVALVSGTTVKSFTETEDTRWLYSYCYCFGVGWWREANIIPDFNFRHGNFVTALRNPREERVINLEVVCVQVVYWSHDCLGRDYWKDI